MALAIACVAALDAPAPLDAAMTPDEAARLRAFAAAWGGPGGPAPMLDAFAPHPFDDLVGDGLSDADDDYENFNPWLIPRQRVSPLT